MNRCESVYNNCEKIPYNLAMGISNSETSPAQVSETLPFVTRSCPVNYIRLGCCKCMRACKDYPQIFTHLEKIDKFNYCVKQNGEVSKLSSEYIERWEPVGNKFVEPCRDGWTRVGTRLCIPGCPLGWADQGDRCLKVGTIILMPFMWQPGDDARLPALR